MKVTSGKIFTVNHVAKIIVILTARIATLDRSKASFLVSKQSDKLNVLSVFGEGLPFKKRIFKAVVFSLAWFMFLHASWKTTLAFCIFNNSHGEKLQSNFYFCIKTRFLGEPKQVVPFLAFMIVLASNHNAGFACKFS